jgi:hypothetical protein
MVALVAFCGNLLSATASAEPIVNYSLTGESGNWLLDFAVTNTLGVEGLGIYFFGVRLPEHDPLASPTGWDSEVSREWTNTNLGGSSTLYNNNWITNPGGNDIDMGATPSGFAARVTSTAQPTSVQWFSFAFGGGPRYEGSDHFYLALNPGFEGVASATQNPHRCSLPGLGWWRFTSGGEYPSATKPRGRLADVRRRAFGNDDSPVNAGRI